MTLDKRRISKGLLLIFWFAMPFAMAQDPNSVTLAGSFQAALGCPGDWQPECPATMLSLDNEDGIWQGTYTLPSGSFEYKAALNGTWDENYGANGQAGGNNLALNLATETQVKFYYDPVSHWITDNQNALIATVAGSFQGAMGCAGDWDPSCLKSWLQDLDGDGTYSFVTSAIPAGTYEAKVTINESWDENYGQGGQRDGSNIVFNVGDNDTITFTFDATTRILTIASALPAGPGSVTIAGSLQDELGCAGDWMADCAASHLVEDSEDGVWQGVFTLPAGDYEYKATLNDSWDENYGANAQAGGNNIALSLGQETAVKFYYSHQTHWVTDNQSLIATVPGDYQVHLGCANVWDPSCLQSWLQDPDGDGIYSFQTNKIPQGTYESKVAINEGWDLNYGADGVPGGDNIFFSVPENGALTTFTFDSESHVLKVTSGEEPPVQAGGYAIIHYQRADGDYGDASTGNYNDYWGLHLWGEGIAAEEATEWTAPRAFQGQTAYGRFAWIKLSGQGGPINFIVHRGDSKDGGDGDRSFAGGQIWLKSGDATNYASQAAAQGFVTLHYYRPDGNYGVGTASYWGLHLWSDGGANAIDPAAETSWDAPRPADGVDAYGAYFQIPLNPGDPGASLKPVKFILHQPSGDNTAPDGDREPGGDRSFIPAQGADAWLVAQDEAIYPSEGAAHNFATLHYYRPQADYGDFGSDDFNNYWGVHVWDGAATPTQWTAPVKASGSDSFGVSYRIDLLPGAQTLAYILHRGDSKDPGTDQFLSLVTLGHEVWQIQGADPEDPYVYPRLFSGSANPGNLNQKRAYWVNRNTIAWSEAEDGNNSFFLVYAASGGLEAGSEGIGGGSSISLTRDPAGLPADVKARFPHLANLPALLISDADLVLVPEILKGQIAVSALNSEGLSVNATGLQIPGVLDDLFTYEGELGLNWAGEIPNLALWAPTAKSVTLNLYDDATTQTGVTLPMTADGPVWRATGEASWKGRFYLYEVEVFVPSTGLVEHNMVTDPYSISLSTNSTRSQFIDLQDPSTMPDAWAETQKAPLTAAEDISIYEVHVRDFSINDNSVPAAHRGTFKAFTYDQTNGMSHILALRDAGLSHIHLLPVFDIATINENAAERQDPDPDQLASFDPDSDQQQALITSLENEDGFNWGYDPYHYSVPEGSYSTDPNGPTRIVEFREMIQNLSRKGLRVVMDVVYNHTSDSGQNPRSVLDRIVPGYYHRLNEIGNVEKSTCCENTASEHNMMEKLMVDSLVRWARDYKVDAFRFDLMGHHMVRNMVAIRAALDSLTLEADGVDGSAIYLYGEGWNFGEVASGARGRNATQLEVGGLGIGTFSDRLRDAVRGGGPFDDGQNLKKQGFGNGLFTNANALDQGDQHATLLLLQDQIRIGLAGNLADYQLIDRNGNPVRGSEIDYNGQPSGYTLDPQEVISYISKHDNQTLYDINVYGLPLGTTMADRVRMQVVGLSTVAYSQGVPFFHAGSDMLRSKSLDRDSYNSGDWFNKLDFTYADNNFGAGLPVASKNLSNWDIMAPLLADPNLKPEPGDIGLTAGLFRAMLRVRYSSRLLRLTSATEVMERVSFHNTGPDQIPGLIVMHVSDKTGEDLDPVYQSITILFNADIQDHDFSLPNLKDSHIQLHPVLLNSADPIMASASFESATGVFHVPAMTTAVFVESDPVTLVGMIQQVQTLMAAGTLNHGQGNNLIQHLQGAERFLCDGRPELAVIALETFVRRVNQLVKTGVLTTAQGQALTDQAAVLIAAYRGE